MKINGTPRTWANAWTSTNWERKINIFKNFHQPIYFKFPNASLHKRSFHNFKAASNYYMFTWKRFIKELCGNSNISPGFVCTIDTCWSDLELAKRLSLKNKDSKCKTFPLKIKQICSSFISHFVPRNSWEQFRLPRIRRRQQMKLF